MRRLVAAILIALACIHVAPAAADHGVVRCGGGGQKACLGVSSPFIERYVKPGGEVTWCVDARAAAYPQFVAQLAATMAIYAEDLHYTQRQVDMPRRPDGTIDPASLACVVRNTMPEVHGCSGCAAWVYTQNLPVLIEYNWRTGITYWYSTDGHELGHATCQIDEFYDKVVFQSWVLTHLQRDSAGRLLSASWIHGYPTVMDVGTFNLAEYAPLGIWHLTAGDKDRCSETLGRDVSEHAIVCGLGAPDQYGNRWDSCAEWWLLTNGGHFKPNAGAGQWFRPDGRLEWDGVDSWGGGARFNQIAQLWLAHDGGIFNVANGQYINTGHAIDFP